MDHRFGLLDLLARYSAHDDREAEMLTRMIQFVDGTPSALDWRNPEGHVTGSAWVLDPARSSVLLTFHRKLERWFQLGGHVEDGESVPQAALREAHEESGLSGLVSTNLIFDVDIHPIPASAKRAAHLHYDVRFLCHGPALDPTPTAESRDVAWVRLESVAGLNPDPSMVRMVAKSHTIG